MVNSYRQTCMCIIKLRILEVITLKVYEIIEIKKKRIHIILIIE